MEKVAVKKQLGIEQPAIMTIIPNSTQTWSSPKLPWLCGISSDVVLTPGTFQAYPVL